MRDYEKAKMRIGGGRGKIYLRWNIKGQARMATTRYFGRERSELRRYFSVLRANVGGYAYFSTSQTETFSL